jgi:carbon storage regulator
MLVLSRQKNQAVVFQDEIIVTVIEIRGDKVRLGIEAPASMSVHREEVWSALQPQNEPLLALPNAPNPPPLTVTLTDNQRALVERFQVTIRQMTGAEPTVEATLAMLFDVIEETEEYLAALVVDGVQGFRSAGDQRERSRSLNRERR